MLAREVWPVRFWDFISQYATLPAAPPIWQMAGRIKTRSIRLHPQSQECRVDTVGSDCPAARGGRSIGKTWSSFARFRAHSALSDAWQSGKKRVGEEKGTGKNGSVRKECRLREGEKRGEKTNKGM